MGRLLPRFSAALAVTLVSLAAHAGDLACPPADEGTITIDGMSDDWTDAPAVESGDDNAGIKLRCDTQGKQLILEIEGRDQRVIRTKQARPGEDHIDLKLGGRSYRVFPAASSPAARASSVPPTTRAS